MRNYFQIDPAFNGLARMLDLEKTIKKAFKIHCPIRYWLYKKTRMKIFFTSAGFHIEIFPKIDGVHPIGRAVYQLKRKKVLIKEVII